MNSPRATHTATAFSFSPVTPASPWSDDGASSFRQRHRHQKPFQSRRIPLDQLGQNLAWDKSLDGKRAMFRMRLFFLSFVTIGLLGAAAVVVTGYLNIDKTKYCLVFEDNFDGTEINTDIWSHDIQVGGFGNHEFELTTSSTNNSFVEDGHLYIVPTLTADVIGEANVLNGYVMNLTAAGTCTGTTAQECVAYSNSTVGNVSVIPPIMSARLTTRLSHSIRFGKVEVEAKLPTGDWMWPAIWMLPTNNVYGVWPMSGEIDIVESRGNIVTSQKDDSYNQVHGTLHWGSATEDKASMTTNAKSMMRNFFNKKTRTFGMEWNTDRIQMWERTRNYPYFEHKFNKNFWTWGGLQQTTVNGSLVADPWATTNTSKSIAPFDEDFYLILNVAVGGTNGWFPDAANKPWSNGGISPAADFWNSRADWLPSWPSDPKERGMAIKSVKMWRIAEKGETCKA